MDQPALTQSDSMKISENGASDRSNPGLGRQSERIEDALNGFVRSKQKGTDSGNYQRNVRRVIEEWITWLADRDEPVETFDQL